MPESCVVFDCNITRDLKEGNALHVIAFSDDKRTKAKNKWVDFVCRTRANWKLMSRSVVLEGLQD